MLNVSKKVSILGLLALATVSLAAPAANANNSNGNSANGNNANLISTSAHTSSASKLLIRYAPNTTNLQKRAIRRSVASTGAAALTDLDSSSEILRIDPNKISVSGAMKILEMSKFVDAVEPDYQLHKLNFPIRTTPSDLWGMFGNDSARPPTFGTSANRAWDLGYKGSPDVAVGVIDEGIQIEHPDLTDNIWKNPGEIPNDGIDNDGNGKVDDVNGWDFLNQDNSVFDGRSANDGIDEHGTHVAGTIGGAGLNNGVTGVSPHVKIISAKFLGSKGGSTDDAIKAIDYLVGLKTAFLADPKTGANIVAINNSWGGSDNSQFLLDAINRAGDAGILFVVAAGNDGSNIDQTATYPAGDQCVRKANGAARDWDCIVTVAAINNSGGLSKFSNYGNVGVDIAAPGGDCTQIINQSCSNPFDEILSTVPIDNYGGMVGTSMATPHVTGAIALCAAANPNLTAKELRDLVMNSASSADSLRDKVVTSGRLDVFTLIHGCAPASDNLAPIVVNKSIPNLQAGQPVAFRFSAMAGGDRESNGKVIYTWRLTGKLPNGVFFNDVTGALSGAPTEVGNFPITLSVTSVTDSDPRSFTLRVSKISQSNFAISNQVFTSYTGTSITLTTTGGSGNGAVTFTTPSPNCFVTNDVLMATSAVDCLIRATKAESGIYSSATSNPVIFSFTAAPVTTPPKVKQTLPILKIQSSFTGKSLASLAGLQFSQKSTFTLSVSQKYVKVCQVRKAKLVTTKTKGTCKVTIRVSKRDGKNTSTKTIVWLTR